MAQQQAALMAAQGVGPYGAYGAYGAFGMPPGMQPGMFGAAALQASMMMSSPALMGGMLPGFAMAGLGGLPPSSLTAASGGGSRSPLLAPGQLPAMGDIDLFLGRAPTLDLGARSEFLRLSPSQQADVMREGDLVSARNPSAVLIGRIRRVQRGPAQ